MAQMQLTAPMNAAASNGLGGRTNESNNPQILTSSAPGLELLYDVCRQVYPGQENPLQVTAFIKYWLVSEQLLPVTSQYPKTGKQRDRMLESNKIKFPVYLSDLGFAYIWEFFRFFTSTQ